MGSENGVFSRQRISQRAVGTSLEKQLDGSNYFSGCSVLVFLRCEFAGGEGLEPLPTSGSTHAICYQNKLLLLQSDNFKRKHEAEHRNTYPPPLNVLSAKVGVSFMTTRTLVCSFLLSLET